MRTVRRWQRLVPLLCGLACLGAAYAQEPDHHDAAAQGDAGLVFFLSGEARHFSGKNAPRRSLNEDAALSANVVLTISRDKFRLFGEYLYTTEEHDLERFQLGYEPIADTFLWLGRFHQPASAWNTEHHHGRYLQTAITRPAVELWEDEGGILPQHVTGLLVESRVAVGDASGLHAQFGTGLAPRIEGGELEPFDLLHPSREGRLMSWSGRLAYLPRLLGSTQIGVVAAHYRLPVADPASSALASDRVRQDVTGGFATVHAEPWLVVAAVYDIRIALDGSKEDFQAGYLQVERQLGQGFTVYARGESSSGAADSRYIATDHRSFDLRNATAGLRWDFRNRQALTLEAARSTSLDGHRSEWRLQWSAALQ